MSNVFFHWLGVIENENNLQFFLPYYSQSSREKISSLLMKLMASSARQENDETFFNKRKCLLSGKPANFGHIV